LNEVGSFWYSEVGLRVRYRRKKVHVRYVISWWVLVWVTRRYQHDHVIRILHNLPYVHLYTAAVLLESCRR